MASSLTPPISRDPREPLRETPRETHRELTHEAIRDASPHASAATVPGKTSSSSSSSSLTNPSSSTSIARVARGAVEKSETPLEKGLWEQILAHVRAHHPTLNRTWFDDLRPRQLTGGVIQVLVATAAQLNFCQNTCQQPFTAAAQAATGRLIAVTFHFEQLSRGGVFQDAEQPLPLSPDYTFDQFVTGPCNRLPHAASIAVSENPGRTYNPLFIHGGVGLGKTHLLQAICQRVLERTPDARILYLSCDSFINQFITAVETGDMGGFRHRFRNVDVLVIDDIHFLAGKDRTQEEFFHTFNTLYQQQKQIILSADCPPSEIPELEERLVSRFNWGLVARIDKPCYETRCAILQKKAKMRGLAIPDDVITYVANRVENNTRELEGAIIKLQGFGSLADGKIDLDLARTALGDTRAVEQKRITIQQILEAVTKYYNVKLADLQGKRRHKSIAFPRQVCMYLARKHTRFSLEEIGGYFGGRDHTTVLHAVRTVTADMEMDQEVAKQLNQLEHALAS